MGAIEDANAYWDDFAKKNANLAPGVDGHRYGMTVVSNPDGSHAILTGPYDNGLYERIDYPPGTNGSKDDPIGDQSKITHSSVKADGKTVVPEEAGQSPGSAARKSGANKGTAFEGTSPLGHVANALGLGEEPTPESSDKGGPGNPNPSYQTEQNFQTRGDLLGYDTADRAAGDKIVDNQNKLLSSYNRTINDPNAPSQARTMLAINNDLNNRSELGSAAGVGGANAFAARRQALNNIAQRNIGTAQAMALARAKEVSDAQSGSATVMNNQSTVNQARQNSDLSAGLGFAKEAADSAQKLEEEKMKAKEKESARDQTFFNRVVNAASMGMSSGLGSA